MKIKLSENRRVLINDSFFYLLTKVIPGLIGLVSVLVFIRWVGPEEYGQYTLFLSFIMAIGALSAGWLNQSVVRYYSRYKDGFLIKRVVTTGFMISVSLGSLVLTLCGHLFLEVRDFLYLIILFVLGSIILFRLKTAIIQANLKPKKVTLLVSSQAILGLILPVTFLWVYPFFQSILLGLALAYLIPSIFAKRNFVQSRNKRIGEKEESYSNTIKQFMRFGFPISLFMSLGFLIPFFDRFLIDHFFGSAQTGNYASYAELITRLYSVILFPITLAVYPRMTHLWNNGEKKLTYKLWKLALIVQSFIFGVTFLASFVFGEWIFSLIQLALPNLSPQFQDLLIPLLVSGFLWQISLLIHKPLELKEKPIYMVLGAIIALCISIAGNVMFLPKFGVIATAYTSIVSAFVYIFLVIVFVNNQRLKMKTVKVYS